MRMSTDLVGLSLANIWVLATFLILAIAALVVVLIRLRSRINWVRLALIAAGAALVGGLGNAVYAGIAHAVLGDGETTPASIDLWIAAGCAGAAVAIYAMVVATGWQRAIAVPLIVLAPLAAVMQINAITRQYSAVRSVLVALGAYDVSRPLASIDAPDEVLSPLSATTAWTPPANVPTQGVVESVTIPATVSGFAARNASVYLPPAALTENPPELPVIIALSGQPGSPDDWLGATEIAEILDQVAADNNGIAPILVSPDQLGNPDSNPMCVDSPLGNSATYIMVDVRNWILDNLPVSTNRLDWTMAGFSEGATCTMELGAANPQIFGQLVPISSELVPTLDTLEETLDLGFGGDEAAYDAVAPINVLEANAPSDQIMIAGAGELDSDFTQSMEEIVAAAQGLGMNATFVSSPGTGHDWDTVQYVFSAALPVILERAGLAD